MCVKCCYVTLFCIHDNSYFQCGTTQVEVDASGLLTYPTEKGDAGSGDQRKF